MAISTFTPIFQITPAESISPYLSKFSIPTTRIKHKSTKTKGFTKPFSSPVAIVSDPFILQIAESLEDFVSSSSPPPLLQKLRDSSSESLLSTHWPSRKDEPFRFTYTSFIKKSQVLPIAPPPESFNLLGDSSKTQFPNHSIVDGYIVNSLSQLSELPDGVFVGSLSNLNSEAILKRVSEFESGNEGDLFWSLNGVGTPDLIVVYVPEGCSVENPLHLRYISYEGEDKETNKSPVSNPRVMVLVVKRGEISIIEVNGDENKYYWGIRSWKWWLGKVQKLAILTFKISL